MKPELYDILKGRPVLPVDTYVKGIKHIQIVFTGLTLTLTAY